nr:hypothetical protein [Thiomonas sp. X19]
MRLHVLRQIEKRHDRGCWMVFLRRGLELTIMRVGLQRVSTFEPLQPLQDHLLNDEMRRASMRLSRRFDTKTNMVINFYTDGRHWHGCTFCMFEPRMVAPFVEKVNLDLF